ncbi:MAG: extracellular solute-binding protein [Pseudomonadota bacterium]
MKQILFVALSLLFLGSSVGVFASETLEVGLLIASKGQRISYHKVARQFENEHPEIRVDFVVKDDKEYKLAIGQWLAAETGPDVLYWQAGERLRQFARQGLIFPLDNLWNQEQWDSAFTQGVKDAVSLDGSVFGLPFSYYQWGFYYKKSLFEKLGLQAPKTWDEFLSVCETLKSNGIPAITIGTKNHWPAAGWFDYLNLRINGLSFHQQLMRGGVSYSDERVRKVFEAWKVLVDEGYFAENSMGKKWNHGLPDLYRDRVGMILIGNFLKEHLASALVEDIAFFRFPEIDASLPIYEEAPTEVFLIPKNARNKKAAQQFLSFMGRPEVQATLNEGLGYISPNIRAVPSDSHLIRVGSETLNEARGISQFYDRDTHEEMASQGVIIFSNFLNSGDVDGSLEKLEAVRKRVFQPN